MRLTKTRGDSTAQLPDFEEELDIFQYSDIEFIEKVLIDNTIDFNSLLEFNDPFESAFNYIHRFKTGIERQQFVDENFSGPKTKLIEKVKGLVKDRLSEIVVTCFSKTPFEPLMWAHYSNKHKGVCYCFNRLDIFDRYKFRFRNVKYSNELPSINFYDGSSTYEMLKPQIDDIIYTKSDNWSYEEEFRFYIESQNTSFKFNPKALNAIIIGCKCEKEKEIIKLVKQYNEKFKTNVQILYAIPSTSEYKMNIRYSRINSSSKITIPLYNSDDSVIN